MKRVAIKFEVKAVRDYLLSHGFVYTLRHPRSTGLTIATYTSKDKEIVLANVEVQEIVSYVKDYKDISKYAFMSGLGVVQGLDREGIEMCREVISKKWLELAQKLSGDILNLYIVKIVKKAKV